MLALLLLNAGRVVSMDELAETLWGAGPPPSASVTLQNYVKRLRHTLGAAGRDLILTEPPGYTVTIDTDEFDVSRFEALLGDVRAAMRAGSWRTTAERARAALSLWRGEPLADIESDTLTTREVPRLTEMRLQALEIRVEADLRLGGHAEVVPELERLVDTFPFRENLYALLMLALSGSGRRADALAAYQRVRRTLVDEIGIEPCAKLRDLHQRIMNDGPTSRLPVGAGARTVPQELAAPVSHFVGRAAELRALSELLDRTPDQSVLIAAVDGPAGVGKTALVVQWACQVADRFPDGQLYVNLRGCDREQPMSASDALAGFLHALGVPGRDIPAQPHERAARYRSLLAGRRVLVVADNAASAEQVRPLLPGGAGCAVVITSRETLRGLVARDGARRIGVDFLPPIDSITLLRALIGDRVDADPCAADALVAWCSRLPLALRVIAEWAAAHPATPLAELVERLAATPRRLDTLDAGGDQQTAVRTVLSWSIRHIDPDATRMFRLLGLHPGIDFDAPAAAALGGSELAEAGELLTALARAHLLQRAGTGRFTMHDLLRAYAGELPAEPTDRAALTCLFDHYLYAATVAMDALHPAEHHRRPTVPPSPTPTPPTACESATAQTWLDSERANLVAMAEYTAAHGWPEHTIKLSATLSRYLDRSGHRAAAVTIHGQADRVAQETGDHVARVSALTALGIVAWRQSDFATATDHLSQALVVSRRIGDRPGEAGALGSLGMLDFQMGRSHDSSRHLEQALVLYRQTGDHTAMARMLFNLGYLDIQLGRYQQAERNLQQALLLSRELGDRHGEACTLNNLGDVNCWLGNHDQAAGQYQQALTLFREAGDRNGEANVLTDMAAQHGKAGRHQEAISHQQAALGLYRQIGDRAGEARALNGLGRTALACGRSRHALSLHAAALDIAEAIGDPHQLASAHDGLANAEHAGGHDDAAREHWQSALALYTAVGAPCAEEVTKRLADLEARAARVGR
ncbi:MAG TPA: tetratricopeptide repeat protein [Pseudonocardiaceae bacterium]|nr:tetratricopeptide repeat protein [Pseudonocardiaceae bacterium]